MLRGLEEPSIHAALDELGAAGLQDDARFAAAYVHYRAGRGFGPRRIARELETRGVAADLIAAALAGSEYDFAALARDVRRRKFRHDPGSLAERARQTRFLEYRGFDTQQIRHALERTIDDEDF
ncbi:MAG: regulatory protein RecX [Gammaproteobacteria bacterium]